MLARHAISAQSFREAMSRFGAAVNIVTSDGPEGRLGFTATAVCSLSADPPSLLVCMNRSSSQNKSLQANRVICVNTLAGGQSRLASVFSGAGKLEMAARFGGATWLVLETGAPALADALIAFDCRIVQAIETATHTLLIAEVVALGLGEADGSLMYLHRQFRNLHHPGSEVAAAEPEDALRDRGAALEWL
jgi:flavin reductase